MINRSNSRVENIVATLIAGHRAMRLDPVEYNLILILILCRPGEFVKYLFPLLIIRLLLLLFFINL